MKIVYIAGPYRANSIWEIRQNIWSAEEAATYVWKRGGVALCPHKNSALMDGACPNKQFLEGDLELLRRCDAVLLVSNWGHSQGAQTEVALAEELGLPIFQANEREKLSAWLTDRSGEIGTQPGATAWELRALCQQALSWIEAYIEYLDDQRGYEAEYGHARCHWTQMIEEAKEWNRQARIALHKVKGEEP